MAWSCIAVLGALALSTPAIWALDNGLARTPPMGWRSWEAFYADVDETKMMATMSTLTDRSRGITLDSGAPCAVGSSASCVPTSLADVGFTDVGLDAGFEDCHARQVGGKAAFHDADGRPLVDKRKFPSGMKALVDAGHDMNLTVSWYGNACACDSENSYNQSTKPTIEQAIKGTVAATVEFGFDGLKLDSCSQFNNMSKWAEQINATGRSVLLENCHQGGLVPGQKMPGQGLCEGRGAGASDCPYHVFRTSDDIYNHWINVVNNANSVTPYLTQADTTLQPRSRPGLWAYPDMLETGNMGCSTAKSCVAAGEPIEDRSQFGIWAIISSPLVLSVDLTNQAMLDRVWPILSNREAIGVNQHWNGSPGELLLTDRTRNPSPLNSKGYYVYPAQLGQSRGWEDVQGMVGPPGQQVGPCVDPWTGGPCTQHYMTLGGGPINMTVDAADDWCNGNSSCLGFTFAGSVYGKPDEVTACYFRDETQIFFMDSTLDDLAKPLTHKLEWLSHIKAGRAPPLSPTTSGLQVWVKDVGNSNSDTIGLALLLVNLGQVTLNYTLPLAKLPPAFVTALKGRAVRVRDVWQHADLSYSVGHGGAFEFHNVAPHDSVFYILAPTNSMR